MTWSKIVFANNLKRYMDQKGINQKELAEIVGVSAPTMNDWIKAKKFPRIDKIEILANYFGVLKSELIDGPKKEPTPITEDELSARDLAMLQAFRAAPEYLQKAAMAVLESEEHRHTSTDND